ncbi:CoA pyrophosphatase [Paraferrimonas haliotis]|uniref:CoA pyrophosphatase n=1 Tax=Paraferrimonas haliotis TaxID=2013866 RepID=UPI000BA9B7A3|nr:CoA pyrophosphatase [Paraferrimonas haliotis]
MQLQQAITQLSLSPSAASSAKATNYPSLEKGQYRDSAVLIGLFEKTTENGKQAYIWFTQRPNYMKHHPGQISFPGGKFETSDGSLINTALREAHEEINLEREQAKVIATLPTHYSHTGFAITPVIAHIDSDFSPIAEPNEVVDCFALPLAFFLDEQNFHILTAKRKNQSHPVYFAPYKNRFVWGITAAILWQLKQILRA